MCFMVQLLNFPFRGKATIGNMYINGHGCVPIPLFTTSGGSDLPNLGLFNSLKQKLMIISAVVASVTLCFQNNAVSCVFHI